MSRYLVVTSVLCFFFGLAGFLVGLNSFGKDPHSIRELIEREERQVRFTDRYHDRHKLLPVMAAAGASWTPTLFTRTSAGFVRWVQYKESTYDDGSYTPMFFFLEKGTATGVESRFLGALTVHTDCIGVFYPKIDLIGIRQSLIENCSHQPAVR